MLAACAPAAAPGHGSGSTAYRTRILAVEPAGLPVDVRMSAGDEIRFENAGDEALVLCGYETDGCEPWVRIDADGVFVDHDSPSFYANDAGLQRGDVPADAGKGPADFRRVRRAPPFYAYHDHRVHWMGGSRLPPGVDEGDPSPQRVFDSKVRFRYGTTDGVVRTRLEYVGGRSAWDRYGEQALTAVAIAVMLVVFAVDARRRRRRRDARSEVDPAG